MKFSFFAIVLTLSTMVFAIDPKVGDQAIFDVTTAKGDKAVFQMELTKYNAANDTFTQTETLTVNGKDTKEDKEVKSDDLLSSEGFDFIVANCGSLGGTNETITVKAGKFNSCKLPGDKEVLNIATVPFGIIKSENDEYKIELTSYKYGK